MVLIDGDSDLSQSPVYRSTLISPLCHMLQAVIQILAISALNFKPIQFVIYGPFKKGSGLFVSVIKHYSVAKIM